MVELEEVGPEIREGRRAKALEDFEGEGEAHGLDPRTAGLREDCDESRATERQNSGGGRAREAATAGLQEACRPAAPPCVNIPLLQCTLCKAESTTSEP